MNEGPSTGAGWIMGRRRTHMEPSHKVESHTTLLAARCKRIRLHKDEKRVLKD